MASLTKTHLGSIVFISKRNGTGSGNAVSELDIRGFAGSLEGAKANKGVFVTTSYFTPQARAFTEKITRRIVLIDGQQLAQLMINHDVGVRIEETLHLKKIDEDFPISD